MKNFDQFPISWSDYSIGRLCPFSVKQIITHLQMTATLNLKSGSLRRVAHLISTIFIGQLLAAFKKEEGPP